MSTVDFHYIFKTSEEDSVEFFIRLDDIDLSFVREEESTPPEWARLSNSKCPNCPLNADEHPYCPIAVNMEEPLMKFSGKTSHEQVELEVNAPERTYKVTTHLQKGLGSMLGIYMVTSGCPILDKLRPMVRQHLPVAGLVETRYRAIAMYLTAQYFIHRKGGEPDWELKHLSDIYNDIRVVNKAFSTRIRGAMKKDAGLNALVVLNHFADFVPFSIEEDMLEEMEGLFRAYLD